MLIIENINDTCFNKTAFEKLVKKYIPSCNNVHITFDKNMKDYGSYVYYNGKHSINISSVIHIHPNGNRSGKVLQKKIQIMEMISTFLHESRHMQQRKRLRNRFFSDEYCKSAFIKNDDYYKRHFSKREADARAYEEKNVLVASNFYFSLIEKKRAI